MGIGVDSKSKRCKAEHVGLAGARRTCSYKFTLFHFAHTFALIHLQKHTSGSSMSAEAQREACGEECADDRHDFAGLLRFGRWVCGFG